MLGCQIGLQQQGCHVWFQSWSDLSAVWAGDPKCTEIGSEKNFGAKPDIHAKKEPNNIDLGFIQFNNFITKVNVVH